MENDFLKRATLIRMKKFVDYDQSCRQLRRIWSKARGYWNKFRGVLLLKAVNKGKRLSPEVF